MNWLWIGATFVAAYFVGSIPFGLVAGLLRGVDIRQHGSKNIGATNAGRVLGRPWFFIVLALDALKGAGCALAGHYLARDGADLALAGGVGAIFGHFFSIYLRFKGGKGVATAAGVLLALSPWLGLATLLAWLVVAVLTRYSSLASVCAGVFAPLAAVWVIGFRAEVVAVAAMSAILVWRHTGNIQRLLAGTEGRIGEKKAPATPGQ